MQDNTTDKSNVTAHKQSKYLCCLKHKKQKKGSVSNIVGLSRKKLIASSLSNSEAPAGLDEYIKLNKK